MPTLAIFYGIVISVYWADHPPPHIHARYGEFEAQIDIARLRIIAGSLPRRAQAMVLRWMRDHQDELMTAWNLASASLPPGRIAPLP